MEAPAPFLDGMIGFSGTIGGITGERAALSAHDRREVADRQTQVAVRILAIANLANLASIVLTVAFMIPPGRFRWIWGAAMLATISNSCRIWWPWVTDPLKPPSPSTRRLLLVDVMAGAVLYAVLAIHVLPQLEGAEQVVLSATLVGVIGSGAIALSSVRSVSLAWVFTTIAGVAIGFVLDGAAELPIELTQMALYGIALSAAIEYLSWSFEQRYRAERAAEREREVVSLLLDDFEGGARDWLWRTDASGLLVSPSARLVECSGLSASQLEQRSILDLVGDAEHLELAMSEARAIRDVVVSVNVRGQQRWWSLSGAPRPDGSWRGVGSDITDTYQQTQEIQHLASFDSLTGLANRHRLRADLQQLVTQIGPGQQVRVAILDLDNFKTVNDTLGHPIGDRLLVEVADRLRRAVPADHTCARLGGDEFAIVALIDEDPEDARRAAGEATAFLDAMFGEPYLIDGTRLEIRGSIGYASIPTDAADADEVVMLADLALYAAKDQGRGKIFAFEPEMRAAAEAKGRSLDDLRRAIDHQQIEVWFQPLVTASGHVGAFEALARWHHPEHGWIPPTAFIPVAEETGLIVPLGEQILGRALEMAASLPHDIRIAINVSPVQLVSSGLATRFRDVLARHEVTPSRVEIEITESAAVDPAARSTIAELRLLGCGVAIDDFGTGFSSFAALQDMPITQLKVDRAFIIRLDRPGSTRSRAIVQAIVDGARATGLSCVAEGVETAEQRRVVLELGCHLIQGYIESKPMPAAEVPGFLASREP